MLITQLIYKEENSSNVKFKKDKVLKAYKELTGEDVTNPENLLEKNSFMYYDKVEDEFKYSEFGTDGFPSNKVLEIKDINYLNGVYSADIIFVGLSEGDNNIEDLDQYEMNLKFKLNTDYKYSKYQIIDIDSLSYKLYSEKETADSNGVSNSGNTTQNTVSNASEEINETTSQGTQKEIKIGKSIELLDGMSFRVDKIVFMENYTAELYTHIIEGDNIPQNRRINFIDISYQSALLGGTGTGKTISETENEFDIRISLPLITNDINNISLVFKCDSGLIANSTIDLLNKNVKVDYLNDSLKLNDNEKNEKELKDTIGRFILMNYYKDTQGNGSQEGKNEMMLYTAFLLDEDGMFRNFGINSTYTELPESIVYSIVKGYTGINFDVNTSFSKIIMTRIERKAGGEPAIKYISGTKYNLAANIKEIENIENNGNTVTVTFTYSYNLNPNNTYRAIMNLEPYEYDNSNPIAKQFVLYRLTNADIYSEKVN